MSIVAAIQLASGPNIEANLLEVSRLIAAAVEKGAKLIVLPENFALMGMSETDKLSLSEPLGEGRIQDFLSTQAADHEIWIVGGTIPLQSPDPDRVYATSLVYNAKGKVAARYDKIHLFDVELSGTSEQYNESETIKAGDKVVVVDSPFGRLGVAICYDLRFPELFRIMLDQGVEVVALPAAFTAVTGKAHWEILIRARAIENLIYVVAAGQGGYHVNGRKTYGYSMVVDPWGSILDRFQQGSGMALAPLDLPFLETTRGNFPAIEHRRLNRK
ncbi:MAG: carbon-nitrogen hydrolase family protein [Gammaproteobacteria bacterium]|nr:carbon-nitrogen hydrolase family protein [Gammaproteobacteria bacterium]